MMKPIYIFLICLVSILETGCSTDKIFDEKSSKNLATPETLDDLQALLDNASTFNSFCPGMGENASDYHFFRPEIAGSLIEKERNAYTWSKEQPYIKVTDWVNGAATGSYGRIYQANLILETLEKIGSNVNRDQFISIKGQALFYRGKSFFELAQTFVPPYDSSTGDEKFGLPLRLESDIVIKSARSTISETYDRILLDLNTSIDQLPNSQLYRTRPSKAAAYAMLARVHLALENYDEALKFSNLALQINNVLMKYSDLTYNTINNPFIGYNSEIIFYSYINSGSRFSFSSLNIDSVLYKSYNDNDIRKKAFFNFNTSTKYVTYKGTYAGQGFNHFFNGLATDELYLIRAECYAREGKVAEAMKDLNALLKTRWLGTYADLTAANPEEALIIVLRERKKEMVLRGVRWSDLRRLNKDPRFVQTFNRVVSGKTYTLEPNSYKYTFPIPDDIMEVTDLEQNPGWE